jgi:hypothetical protein
MDALIAKSDVPTPDGRTPAHINAPGQLSFIPLTDLARVALPTASVLYQKFASLPTDRCHPERSEGSVTPALVASE